MIVLGDLAKYGAIKAKVGAMSRNLLKAHDYRELISQRNVAEAALYLKNETAYEKHLNDTSTIHRNELENLMRRAYTEDMARLYNFDNSDNKKFYAHFYIKAEIEWLKIAFRGLINKDISSDLLSQIPPAFKKRFTIEIDKLASCTNMNEFLDNLRGTRYESVISPIITLKEHQNLFSVEMTLDMYYYSLICSLREGLRDTEDRHVMECIMGSEIDMLNLLWIYRSKKYFKMPNELIYSFIIPNKYKLSRSDIIRLVDAKSAEEFIRLVENTPYRKAFSWSESRFYEQSYGSYIYFLHKKMAKAYPYSVETVISYLHFKDTEIRNITSAIEGIRYGLLPEKIKPYIIGFSL